MSYATYCAPRAVAAVSDLTPTEAAAALSALSEHFGEPAPTTSTEYHVLVRTLMALGLSVQGWDPVTAQIRARAGRYRAQMMRPWRVTEADRAARTRKNAPVSPPPDVPPSLTVAEWCDRFAWGTWVLSVAGHVLVARDSRVIEGDPESKYGDHHLVAVERILERRHP